MHPLIFDTEFFSIHTLWLFISLSIFVTAYFIVKLGVIHSLKLQFISDHSWPLMIWALLGARVFGVITNYQSYFYELTFSNIIQVLYFWDKNLSFFGGALAAGIYFYKLCEKKEQNFWKWMDVIVPSAIIGLTISHLGAFFDGINYGNETSLPWGVNFESPVVKYTVPIHPTQIYAFIYSAIIAGILVHLYKLEKVSAKESGFVALIGVMSYSFMQFLEEFVRGDDTLMLGPVRVGSIITLLIFIGTSIFFHFRYNRPAKT